jgi:hypothetical protein
MHGIPINHLSRWLGHASITPALVYLELVPDPAGSLAMVPDPAGSLAMVPRHSSASWPVRFPTGTGDTG